MIKYIKMTASSNFGNIFSVLIASAFLPFLPMASIHLILLNLIYDISCTAIPWDNVDKEFLTKPRKWDASSVSKFMLWIGPTSSVFDILTYAPVTLLTFIGIAVLTVIPFTAVGHAIGLASLPGEYFSWLAAITLAYMLLATMMKKLYIKRYGELL